MIFRAYEYFPRQDISMRSSTRITGGRIYIEPTEYYAMMGLDDTKNDGWMTPNEMLQVLAVASRQSAVSPPVARWWATNFSTTAVEYAELAAKEARYILTSWVRVNRASWTPTQWVTALVSDSTLNGGFLYGYYSSLQLAGGKNTTDGSIIVKYYKNKYSAGLRAGIVTWDSDLRQIVANPMDVASEVLMAGMNIVKSGGDEAGKLLKAVAQGASGIAKGAGSAAEGVGTLTKWLPYILVPALGIAGYLAFKNRNTISEMVGRKVSKLGGR